MMRGFISIAVLGCGRALRENAPQTCSIKSARTWRRFAAWVH
jgi:hypothetical protein